MLLKRNNLIINSGKNFEDFIKSNLGNDINTNDQSNNFIKLNDKMKKSIISMLKNTNELKNIILNHEKGNEVNLVDLDKNLNIINVDLDNLKKSNFILLEISVELNNNSLYNNGCWTIEFQVKPNGRLDYIGTNFND